MVSASTVSSIVAINTTGLSIHQQWTHTVDTRTNTAQFQVILKTRAEQKTLIKYNQVFKNVMSEHYH